MTEAYRYRVARATPKGVLDWGAAAREASEAGAVSVVRPEGSGHVPRVQFRLVANETELFLHYRVEDRFVRSVCTAFQGPVCRDSCVEFFVQPCAGLGYFNFEMNACGVLHLWYIEDPARTADGFACGRPVSLEAASIIEIEATYRGTIEPEIVGPVVWELGCRIPLAFFEQALNCPVGFDTPWRGNFYKLGSDTSRPHWLSWAPVGAELNFHCPEYFGYLDF